MMPAQEPQAVLPMWKGRRGVINTLICGILGVVCAFAFWQFAVRTAVMPACMTYGKSHELTYVDYKVYSSQRHASSACIFKTQRGGTQDVALPEAASYLTDLWVGVAFNILLTIPSFILLFAIAGTGITCLGRKRAKA
jgi:hypothetical protein